MGNQFLLLCKTGFALITGECFELMGLLVLRQRGLTTVLIRTHVALEGFLIAVSLQMFPVPLETSQSFLAELAYQRAFILGFAR